MSRTFKVILGFIILCVPAYFLALYYQKCRPYTGGPDPIGRTGRVTTRILYDRQLELFQRDGTFHSAPLSAAGSFLFDLPGWKIFSASSEADLSFKREWAKAWQYVVSAGAFDEKGNPIVDGDRNFFSPDQRIQLDINNFSMV